MIAVYRVDKAWTLKRQTPQGWQTEVLAVDCDCTPAEVLHNVRDREPKELVAIVSPDQAITRAA